jgi:hypothetical protein
MNHRSTAMQCPPTPQLEYRDPGMAVGKFDDFPDVEPELIADQRQLVGEGDIDIAEGVLTSSAVGASVRDIFPCRKIRYTASAFSRRLRSSRR